MSMYIEVVSIIACRVMYVAFFRHRYVVNLGYRSDGIKAITANVTTMVVAAFGEIIFEVIVDAFALEVESRLGIDLDDFWEMWRQGSTREFDHSACVGWRKCCLL